MRTWIVRTTTVLSAAALLSACGDSRLGKLTAGISQDSAAVIMKADAPHRKLSYLTGGKLWEVFMYANGDTPATDSIAWGKLAPVVFADGKVAGWGWSWWEDQAAKLEIPMPVLK